MGVSKELLTVTAGQDNMAAAVELAELLESKGYAAHPMRMMHSMLGIATIHIHHEDEQDEIILVETGDVKALRESVDKLQQMPASSPVDWALATPLDVPPDVDAVMGDSAVALLNHQWTISGLVPLSAKISEVSAIAEKVAASLQEAGHGTFALSGGVDTLRAIDTFVMDMRPAGSTADDETMPLAFVVGLGLLATQTAQQAFGGGGELGRLTNNFTSFEPCNTIAEAQGFPVLALPSGHALQFSGKVHRRWASGADESLVELFERSSASGAGGNGNASNAKAPTGSASSASAPKSSASDDKILRKLAALAPFSMFLMVGTENGQLHQGRGKRFAQALFEEVDTCPAIIQDVVGEISLAPDKRFEMVARNQDLLLRSLGALGIVAKQGGKSGEDVFDWMTNLATELSSIDGEPDAMKLMMVMAGLTHDREKVLEGGDPFDASNRTATDGQLARAGDAIVGGFIMVAIADGSVDKEEIDIFLKAIVALKHPLLVRMRDASGDPREIIEKQLQNPSLIMVALQSAYTVFEQDEGGSAARKELMGMFRDVAFADGDVHPREQLALDIIQDVLYDGSTDRRPERAFPVWIYGVILVLGLLAVAGCGWACMG